MLTLLPKVSEKSYGLAQTGTYVFSVPRTANKATVKAAVEAEFKDTKVKDVRLVVVKGKAVRAYRGKRQNPGEALRTTKKKAYVTLSEGSIEMFKEEKETK